MPCAFGHGHSASGRQRFCGPKSIKLLETSYKHSFRWMAHNAARRTKLCNSAKKCHVFPKLCQISNNHINIECVYVCVYIYIYPCVLVCMHSLNIRRRKCELPALPLGCSLAWRRFLASAMIQLVGSCKLSWGHGSRAMSSINFAGTDHI